MRKVLIANRGEIAVRIARACRDAGLASVAVYARADRDAVHVRAADEAVPLNGTTPADTYLDVSQLLRAAAGSGADALHPGYGFLAESPEFAQAVLDAGLTWIGPPPAAIRLLGDKLSARQAARQAGVPLLPAMTWLPGRRPGGGVRTRARAARRDQGRRRRRRERRRLAWSAAEIPDACARVCARRSPRAAGRMLRRALPGPCAARRGPVPGRRRRRRRGDIHKGLLAAAAPPEDRGRGPRAVPARWPGRAAAGGIRGDPAGGGLYRLGDVRVPARPGRHARIPGGERQAGGRAPGQRGSHRARPGPGVIPDRRGRCPGPR